MLNKDIQELSDLIRSVSSSSLVVDEVPCFCGHEKAAKQIINDFIYENPQYSAMLKLLCCYGKIKTAQKIREQAHVDDNFYHALNACSSELSARDRYRQDLLLTDEIIEKIDKIILNKPRLLDDKEAKVFLAVFYPDTGVDGIDENQVDSARSCSVYFLQQSLAEVLKKVSEKYAKYFDRKLAKFDKMNQKLDTQTLSIMHDTEILLGLLPDIRDMAMRLDILGKSAEDGVDYKLIETTVNQCMNLVDPSGVLRQFSMEIPEVRIAATCGKSRTYVRTRYSESIRMLSYVLWGYSVRLFLFT